MHSRILLKLSTTLTIRNPEDDIYYGELSRACINIHWIVNGTIKEKVNGENEETKNQEPDIQSQ